MIRHDVYVCATIWWGAYRNYVDFLEKTMTEFDKWWFVPSAVSDFVVVIIVVLVTVVTVVVAFAVLVVATTIVKIININYMFYAGRQRDSSLGMGSLSVIDSSTYMVNGHVSISNEIVVCDVGDIC